MRIDSFVILLLTLAKLNLLAQSKLTHTKQTDTEPDERKPLDGAPPIRSNSSERVKQYLSNRHIKTKLGALENTQEAEREPASHLKWALQNRPHRSKREANETGGKCELDRPAIFGIRCNECELHEGALVIKASKQNRLTLFGRDFSAELAVALTADSGSTGSDCTHADRIKSVSFVNVSSSVGVALVEVEASEHPRPFHLCLRDSRGVWRHQGDEIWLRLVVKEDFLPVYMKIIVIACLLMLSGLFSGLNLGLMALDKNELQVIISCGSETEKRYARAIEPVRRRGNYLLCSILFSNVLVNSTIAVLLEELTSGIVAVMTSTIFIVMFGEILPQAFCSRHGLAVGAKTVSMTYFCMILTFPLSYPVSACLDWALGEEIGQTYDRERLMEFIRVTRDYNHLETDEVNIISGALKLKRIPLSEVMTRIEDVFMLDLSSCLDFDTIQAIIERGYSRVPVHEPGNKKNIVALLFAKDLALLDPDDRTPVQTLISIYNHPTMFLFEDTTLDFALNEFKTGKSHMAFVRRIMDDGDRDPVYEITGVVTLEDVIEEIMQMEINDETDTLSDNRRKRRRKEAQVRPDFAQFTQFGLGDGEASSNLVSPQLCLAAYQYLATTVEPFTSKFITDNILRRLMSQRIYFRVRVDDSRQAMNKRLFTSGEPVDYFVMILEGRVNVVCGKESLVFEAGPFSCFGRAALTTPADNTGDSHQEARTRHEGVAELELKGSLELTTFKASNSDINLGVSLRPNESSSSLAALETTKTYIVPDYTVEVVADTSYLKVTRSEYLAALRATLVERDALESGQDLAERQNRHSSTASTPQTQRFEGLT